MQLETASFEEERIHRYCMGAGVIPISVDDAGDVHLLLGRERWCPNWKGVVGEWV